MSEPILPGVERWDLCDASRTPLGMTHPRGRQFPMPAGTYHVVVYIFTTAADGRLLLTRRSQRKRSFPGFWEITGGSVLAGEDSFTAARRELSEETGLMPPAEAMAQLASLRIPGAFVDVYHDHLTTPAAETPITLQEGETEGHTWVTFYELERHIQAGDFPPTEAMAYGAVRSLLMEQLEASLWLGPVGEADKVTDESPRPEATDPTAPKEAP